MSHLFRCAVEHEPGALQQLLEHYRPLLTHLASRRLTMPMRSKVGASDLVQITVWKATQAFPRQEFKTRRGFHAWLLAIFKNEAAMLRRRYLDAQKRDVSRERPLSDPEVQRRLARLSTQISAGASALDRADAATRILTALKQLPDHYQLVLKLRYIKRLSYVEIGAIIDRPKDAARMVHNRAILKLKQVLEGDGS